MAKETKSLRFLTENGTWYEIRDGHWYRLSSTERSGRTRTENGRIIGEPTIEVGYPAIIEDGNVLPGMDFHFLKTSRVVAILT